MSLVLPQRYTTWQEEGFLVLFLAGVTIMALVGMGMRPPPVMAMLSRTMQASTLSPGAPMVERHYCPAVLVALA